MTDARGLPRIKPHRLTMGERQAMVASTEPLEDTGETPDCGKSGKSSTIPMFAIANGVRQ